MPGRRFRKFRRTLQAIARGRKLKTKWLNHLSAKQRLAVKEAQQEAAPVAGPIPPRPTPVRQPPAIKPVEKSAELEDKKQDKPQTKKKRPKQEDKVNKSSKVVREMKFPVWCNSRF